MTSLFETVIEEVTPRGKKPATEVVSQGDRKTDVNSENFATFSF